ncbi:hypothetical protein EST92_11560 [Streptomyces sp. TM32]|uniref:hypothetical protein n=1 Tax=Streptomyces sp. TM32 TaxID=1652669 RepID=UPI0010131979|nr:hypothetical protein [Streptomyces sp. TM32]RXS84188.1 hypothetical protein EST92_11560 [Streptomyces sp. TM32]
MTTSLEQAAQAEADAREAVFRERNLPAIDRLIRAVRRHDAELVRAYRDSLPFDGEAAAAMSLVATHIDPKEQS